MRINRWFKKNVIFATIYIAMVKKVDVSETVFLNYITLDG